ncbi:uncharacterized protein EV420DRAFT_1114076 [Desarmillaria tabescens]|uniref:Uncharacterized protein n=1 Tax=Armillaria tabescens TaxID=1929756 RepID=A0AA39TUI0_ARMTA|nr:uncharacterized protein EV420DRAFT_1114076 [Desarmillaria tabescens]KAK0463904.1 hypothetical protein EV420DRAFT_1114076 [Desarmillaria tabescens]
MPKEERQETEGSSLLFKTKSTLKMPTPTNSAILLSYLGHDDTQEVPSAAQNTDASQDVLSFSSRTYTPTLATPEILFIITLFFSVLQLVTNGLSVGWFHSWVFIFQFASQIVAVCYLMYTIHDRIGRYRTSRPIIARYFFLSINIVPILVTFTTTVVHKLT